MEKLGENFDTRIANLKYKLFDIWLFTTDLSIKVFIKLGIISKFEE